MGTGKGSLNFGPFLFRIFHRMLHCSVLHGTVSRFTSKWCKGVFRLFAIR
jgi:hypothetical protein